MPLIRLNSTPNPELVSNINDLVNNINDQLDNYINTVIPGLNLMVSDVKYLIEN